MWLSTRKPLNEIPDISFIMKTINEFDGIDDTNRNNYANEMEPKLGFKCYDYHLCCIPAAHVADIFPSLYPFSLSGKTADTENTSDDKQHLAVSDNGEGVVSFEKGSLADFAIANGCSFMDMSTLTTYRPL